MKRLFEGLIKDHFKSNRQMCFIGGPRQVGKTTITELLQSNYPNFHYFNWDNNNHKYEIISGPETIANKIGLNKPQLWISRAKT